MRYEHPLEVPFHKQIFLDDSAYQMEAARQPVDNNCQIDAVEVACIEDRVHSHVRHLQLVEDHVGVPKAEVACAPWGCLVLASISLPIHNASVTCWVMQNIEKLQL